MRVSRSGRQSRRQGGRDAVIQVRVSPEQNERLRAAAAAQGVSVQAHLLDRAEVGPLVDGWTARQRRAVAQELLQVRRILAGIGTNVNQIAKAANTDGAVNDDEIRAALVALHERLPRLDAVAAELGGE